MTGAGPRVGFLGPEGTFSAEALSASPLAGDGPLGALRRVALPTISDAVLAVAEGEVELAIVPIENSLEGSVDDVLDALALDAPEVEIVAEAVHPVHHCLIAAPGTAGAPVRVVISHPQVVGQCSRLVRSLAGVEVMTTSSSAEAVRMVAEAREPGRVALGNRLAARLYGGEVVREAVEDHPDNVTRFVWLARRGDELAAVLAPRPGDRAKTSLLFWGEGAGDPGWLVGCLAELAERGINLTRIESRPRGPGLGRYMFFADLEGGRTEPHVDQAVRALERHCDEVRVLGSFAAA